MKYLVNHDYRSSRAGLDAGTIVDLSDEDAEWFERDSPGVLSPADGEPEGLSLRNSKQQLLDAVTAFEDEHQVVLDVDEKSTKQQLLDALTAAEADLSAGNSADGESGEGAGAMSTQDPSGLSKG